MYRGALLALALTSASGCLLGDTGAYEPMDDSVDAGIDGDSHDHHDDLLVDPNEPEPDVLYAPSLTVDQVMWNYCSTAPVRGLSEQIAEEIECLRPGTMASLSGIPGVSVNSGTLPYLQREAAASLGRVTAGGGTISINSGLRSTAQQYILYRWDQLNRCRHVVITAAPPGGSNHESGLAIDVSDAYSWRSRLGSRGFRWFGSGDAVHFDYVTGGTDIRHLAVQAFQRLWNRNNPGDRISEDGDYGGTTESRLKRAPAAGFARGPSCSPMPSANAAAMEVFWQRERDGSYALRALAPQQVNRVEYYVDGYPVGEATRGAENNFPTSYRFTSNGSERRFEARGFDGSGELVARGVGLMDVTDGAAIYIRQMGKRLYEIGMEGAPEAIAAIEVDADQWTLTDSVTGQARSTRKAVRSTFTMLGERTFKITTFNADGSSRGSLYRTFTLE